MTTIKQKMVVVICYIQLVIMMTPRTLTEAEQKAWASNIGVSGIGLSESESMLGLFARRLEFNNSPMMMENF